MTDPDGNGAEPVLPGIDRTRLSVWYGANIPGTELPLSFELIAGGRSNLTYRVVDAAGHATVLRRPPTGQLLPTAHDMAREHRLIAALGPAGVPVPPALGLCTDEEVTGSPFYVMGFVDGFVVRTAEQAQAAWGLETRRSVARSLVETLARIHSVDPDAAGLGDLSRREGYVARQLKRWYAQYQASRDEGGGPDIGLLDEIHLLLSTSIPEQGPATVVHGDYRLDNTVVGRDHTIKAVLDWELCTLGDPMADLGALLAYWNEPGEESPLGQSATGAEGFPLRAEVADMYADASGRDLSQLDYYYAFAVWKVACILEGVYVRYVAGAMGEAGFDYSFYPAAIEGLAKRAHDALTAG